MRLQEVYFDPVIQLEKVLWWEANTKTKALIVNLLLLILD